MKKILKGLLCTTAVVGMLLGNVQSVFAADATYEIVADKTSVNVGDTFTVTVNIKDNPGINAITAYLDYDSSKIIAKKAVEVTNPAVNFINTDTLNGQINLTPSATNADYTALSANGTKTAAQLGRIKVAGFLYDSTNETLVQSTDNGAIISIEFESIAAGDAAITFKNIKTSGYANNDITSATVADGNSSVTSSSGGGDGGEDKPNPPSGDKYTHLKGDVDDNKVVNSTDAALIIKCANGSPEADFESDADRKLIADVDINKTINSTDAALVIKKTIDNSFTFPGGDTVEVSKNYYPK